MSTENGTEILNLTALELARKIAARELSAREVTKAYLERIEATEPKINAYLTVTAGTAYKQADAVDEALDAAHVPGPLAGVPVAIKDNILTGGVTTTAASKILQTFVPPYNATVTDRLKAAGAVLLGKTNLDEFAMGSSCEHSAFKTTRNPWDRSLAPGGSSGGSAAATAAASAALALGSDTGGSIRQPASFCGVCGLKPTYGLVPRYGLIAFASSLDQIGPLGRDTHDLALLMSVIAGHDPNDSTSLPSPPPDFFAELEDGVEGMRLGVPKEYVSQVTNDHVRKSFDSAIETYRNLGATVEEVSLPHAGYGIATYYIIATAECSSNLARYTGIHYCPRQPGGELAREVIDRTRTLFGTEVKRRIMLGSFVLSSGYYDAYYLRAARTRSLIKQDFDQVFCSFDAVLSPTAPAPPFALGEKLADPLQMYLCDVMTVGANLAGIPGLSIPCTDPRAGLPVGLQILGPRLSDGRLLRIGRAFERETGCSNRIAPLENGNGGAN